MCSSEPRIKKTPQSQAEKTERNTATAMASTNKSNISLANSAQMDEEISKTLTHNNWYHGMMPRDEIEDLLKKDGDFLVRKTDVANKARYAISVFYNKRIRHILLVYDGMWSIRGAKKKTIIELIDHLVKTKYPVQTDSTILITAVPRPEYYILHEHIELGKKLGGGAFGDVHIGTWKKAHGENVEVAIKNHRKVIHRDIAARNCLMGKNDECKISDFGLSVANADVLKLDKLKAMPIRWLSPETLRKGEFSTVCFCFLF
uniref:Tyrosine-protein kinase n=1 Tax=Panagrolaimus superbus TaxID=310955 RepID=A0A914YNY6_9BILA